MKKSELREKHAIYQKPDGSYSTKAIEDRVKADKALQILLSDKPSLINEEDPKYVVPKDVFMDMLNISLLSIGALSLDESLKYQETEKDTTWLNRLRLLCQHQPKPFFYLPTFSKNIGYFYDRNWFRVAIVHALSIITNTSLDIASDLCKNKDIFDKATLYFQMLVSHTTLAITHKNPIDSTSLPAYKEIAKACKKLKLDVSKQVSDQSAHIDSIDASHLEGEEKKKLGQQIISEFS